MKEDNIGYRSERCQTCIFFEPKVDKDNNLINFGECRKNEPIMSGFPSVSLSGWCGQHSIDESKI